MSAYVSPILVGIMVSFGLFYLLSLPVAIYQYRKHNGILQKKSFVWASFILYMITAWFMTILPLPAPEAVANMTPAQANYKPFLFVTTFLEKSGFVLSDKSTWLKSLKSHYFYTVAFNVLLTFPFGVYMRKYFHQSFFKTILLGFLLSFFYEFTQYTGLFGIYPHPYRVADVDDLIVNTFGVFLGFIATPLISKLLPTVEEGALPVERQVNVGLVRRFIGVSIDLIAVSFFSGLLSIPFALLGLNSAFFRELPTLITYFLYFFLMVYLTKGKTFGFQLVKIKIISTSGHSLAFWQVLVRSGILLLFIKGFPALAHYFSVPNPSPAQAILSLSFSLAGAVLVLIILISRLRKKFVYFYETLSKTRLTSKVIHVDAIEKAK